MCKKLTFLTSFLLVLGLVSNTMAQIDPATVETGHVYLLEDVNDGAVSDDSANDNTGIIVGDPNLVDGINGKALLFDGVDDGVHIPDSNFINVNNGPFPNRTIIAVFNCADVTKPEKQTVFEEGGLTRGLTIYVFDSQVYVGGWNKAEYQWNPGSWLSAPIDSNQWYTVSLVIRNGADAQEDYKFEMWLDGNLIGIAPGGQLYNHGNDNAIGYTLQNNVFHDGDAEGDGWYFEGMIDEVWILNEAVGELPFANTPTPANGEVDVKAAPKLSWMAPETTFQHDLYLGTDANLVAAGDASVLIGSLAEASYAVDPNFPLSRGITYYWKVDVTTGSARKSELQPGNLWNFRVADENTASWLAAASKDGPAYLDTFVEDGLYDIGALSGDITYEFVVLSNPDEQEASMALIGRRQFGDTEAGLKYEQWNNTGTYGATIFGVVDLDFGVPTSPGEYTHLTFVSSETMNTTTLYVNGALAGSVDSAITLSGLVGIGYGAQGEDMSGSFDNFDGTIFGVAIYDEVLADEMIAAHADAYFNPVTEIIPVNPGTEGLVAYYNFENDANDSSGNNIHGTLVGDAGFAEGPAGYGMALNLDGDGDYVDCGLDPNLDITEQITFTYWMKAVALDKGWNTILSRGDDSWRSSRAGTENSMEAAVGGTSGNYLLGTTPVDDGQWHHVGAVYNGETFSLYVDGELDEIEESTGLITVSSYPLYIGNNSQNTDRDWTGLIDEVTIYNRALSDLEVMYLAGKRVTPVDPGDEGLLAWWACDEGADTVVGDVSGNGRDGALVFGDPAWVEGVSGTAVELVGPTLVEVPPLGMELAEATMGGWILPYGPQPDWSSIIMHRGTGLAHGFNVILPGYQLAYHWNDDSGSWSFRSGDNIAEDDWTFAAVTVDAEKAAFYVNGEAGSVNELAHEPAMWDNNIYLGGDGSDDWITRRMIGALDDVFMYDRALSAGEIRYLMGARAMDDVLGPDITGPGDVIQGVPNDGEQDGSGNFGWPAAETPDLAVDDDVTTKYLHFKGEIEPTGIRIEPASGPSVVVGLTLTTANDDYGRDPIAFELSGSNDSIDGPYTLIASGDVVDFAQDEVWPRFTMNATPIVFPNTVEYKYYQLMFTAVRDVSAANSMQIAEIELRTSKY